MGLWERRVMWSSQTRVCLFYFALLLKIYQAKSKAEHMNLKAYGNHLRESVNCMKIIPSPAERNKTEREGPWRSEVKRNKIVRMMKRGGRRYYDLKIFQNPLRRIF